MSNKITIPQVKYNYALVGLALNLCPAKSPLSPTERLVLMDILQRLPFSSDGQVVDLGKCATWQIHRIQIAKAIGVTPRTVTRAVTKFEQLGLLNVIRRKDEAGMNQANSYVPVVSKFVEFAVTADDTSAEEAAAVAAALSGSPGDNPGPDAVTDVSLTRDHTDTTAPKASTAARANTASKDTKEVDGQVDSPAFDLEEAVDYLSHCYDSESEPKSEERTADYRLPESESYGPRPSSQGYSMPNRSELYSRLMSQ